MDSRAFESAVSELLHAMDESLKARRIVPTLILVYSTIDVMAHLDRPLPSMQKPSRSSGIGAQFKGWVVEFLKPTAVLKAKPEEIWAWRCGIVHSYSFESDLTRRGAARKAFYCFGRAPLGMLRKVKDVAAGKVVPIKIEHLVGQTKQAIERFRAALGKDLARAERVYERAETEFYFNVRI